jgi:hypothetical protein
MKLRIISETEHNKTVYKIQKQYLFFFWLYLTYTEFLHGGDFITDIHTFNTLEEAENFINESYKKSNIKVIKVIKL